MSRNDSLRSATRRTKKPRQWRLVYNPFAEARPNPHVVTVGQEDHYRVAVAMSVLCSGATEFIYKPKEPRGALFAITTASGERVIVTLGAKAPDAGELDPMGAQVFPFSHEDLPWQRRALAIAGTISYRAKAPQPEARARVLDFLEEREGWAPLGALEKVADRDEIFCMIWAAELQLAQWQTLDSESLIGLAGLAPPSLAAPAILTLQDQPTSDFFSNLPLEKGARVFRQGGWFTVKSQQGQWTSLLAANGQVTRHLTKGLAFEYWRGELSWEDGLLRQIEATPDRARDGEKAVTKPESAKGSKPPLSRNQRWAQHLRSSFSALPEPDRQIALWRKLNVDFVHAILDDEELKLHGSEARRAGGIPRPDGHLPAYILGSCGALRAYDLWQTGALPAAAALQLRFHPCLGGAVLSGS